ncbi:1240_t:CDS:2 [Acaulospora colombiana]|uniref:1240_t:CDS:1 n=1 Tax=Acaulospora colombiana TaxID=27376 RepID=A0ACA9JZD3_9GLOM|nr:1240_t:CDS:2 [Acaulospora colombiana]
MSDTSSLDCKTCTLIDRTNLQKVKVIRFKVASTDTPNSIIEAISTYFGYQAFDLYEGDSLCVKSYSSFTHEGWHEVRPAGSFPQEPLSKFVEEMSLERGKSDVINVNRSHEIADHQNMSRERRPAKRSFDKHGHPGILKRSCRKKRQQLACNACRKAKKKCVKPAEGPCDKCRKFGKECQIPIHKES